MSKIDGIDSDSIDTDVGNKVCSFKVTDPNLDYKSKLAELAKSNTHLKDFQIQ